ncbi:alpha/beta fold hydrolase [Chitinophaga sp. CF418]|uniref:alpha/beta fold hydrolase n=1 Tax=Chitinophaga sp. CF418 TaxID=1855287 RepID=UPI000910DF51|nr:alpha/beta hydrolase [Chitinophaga sp. CF418]SHN44026.1 Pimeloyl-ACP methyl ester carboxylesterase [Chitinophaga sp. CF418]
MATFVKHTALSADGTIITYDTTGRGPGLIIVHGALSDMEEYTQLAIALSGKFTIHLMQRRDRQGQREVYSIENECQDLLAIQQVTGATFLFGHSFGGLVALETAILFNPFKKIIVYEPGVSINGNWDWLTVYQSAITGKKYRTAFTAFVQGMGHSPLSKAPRWLATFILRIAIRGKDWQLKKKLLVSNLREHQEVKKLEGSYKKYSTISIPVLLAGGQASPDFIADMLSTLTQTIPQSQVLILPGLHHLSPQNNGAPALIADHISDFFGSPVEFIQKLDDNY